MSATALSSDFEQRILEEALSSPAAALMRLSMEIDRQFRILLGSVGRLGQYTGGSPTEALDLLSQSVTNNSIPRELKETVGTFWSIRNAIIHGPGSHGRNLAIRAIDYGLRILRILISIPRPTYLVRYAAVPLFADPECRAHRANVAGVILESFGINHESFGLHIFPSTREYTVGDYVTWEWDLSGAKQWKDTWYRDPITQEPKLAWIGSLEFTGRRLDMV